jgi:SAM-dependent methyltransferase
MTGTRQDGDYRTAVTAAVLDEETFLRLTASGKMRGEQTPWLKVVVRPVLVQGRRRMQFSYFDGKQDISKNFVGARAQEKLSELLAMPFRQFHVQSTTGDLHLRVTKRGKALIRRGKASRPEREPVLAHDRVKRYPIPADPSDRFLQAIGIMGASGRLRAAMQGKFRQINEFIRLMAEALAPAEPASDTLELVDLGCGKAYLTFAAFHYLNHLRGLPARVTGVDIDEQIIESCIALRDSLGWEALDFHTARIAEFTPARPPDLVLSLHACDTATDEAIAQGILWGSRVILAAPCCQHELHDKLRAPVLRPLLRHGILKERTADILTDALRALVLRIMGYRTDVVQFVDPEHTAKNLMIRATTGLAPGDPRFVREYHDLIRFWQVEPAIAGLLGDSLRQHLTISQP